MAKHKVEIEAKLDGKEVVYTPERGLWRKDHDDNGKEKFVFSKREHRMRERDKHSIDFHILSNDDLDLEFVEDACEAMWVIRAPTGKECPKQGMEMVYTSIQPIEVCKDNRGKRTILRVSNANMETENWAFAMNFVRGKDAKVSPGKAECWDPIVKNTNGGSSFLASQPVAVAAGCVVIGATLVAGALWLKD